MKKVYLIYFSPTATTKKVVKIIAEGTGISNIEEINFTLPQNRSSSNIVFEKDALIIFGAPVYMGRVQTNAVTYLKKLKGEGQLAVCVAVYGNRDFGDALVELIDVVTECGFNPIAAAGFIGEHSFANRDNDIGYGRPDKSDLAIAIQFGQQIATKVDSLDLYLPEVRGNRPYLKAKVMPPMATKKTKECNLCLTCKAVCPVGAIDVNGNCDKNKCIACFACVKTCPIGTRELSNPMIFIARKALKREKRKDPELFI